MSKLFMQNRAKIFKEMKDNSVLIIFAGEAPLMHGDELYSFVPQRNFYYLTGIDRPSLILALTKNGKTENATLFLERYNEHSAKWIGAAMRDDEAKELSGIGNYKFVDEFHTYMQSLLDRNYTLYLDLQKFFWKTEPSSDIKFANEARQNYPAVNIINCYSMFAGLRLIKSREELKNIQKAIDITGESFNTILKNCKPGMYEYELEACHDYVLKKNGTHRSFATIAASGINGTVLHYSANNAKTRDGDLLLLDFGASWNWYSADITRTFPINGKFTERQILLYNIVLEANRKVIAAIKPGLPYAELNEIVIDHYDEELKRIGLIKDKGEISKYYYHGVSHSLGLETHDVISAGMILEKGMVFTVEPGLYIAEEGIGIRIEDNIVVTDKGCDVLSKDIIKTVEEIEKFMKE